MYMGALGGNLKVDFDPMIEAIRRMQFMIPFPSISPDIFSIDIGGFTIAPKWYAMAYIIGLIAGWKIIAGMNKRPTLWRDDTAPMTAENVEELLTWIIGGVIIGGRLGFVLFYQPAYYLAHPLEILQVWNGGMAFHGGFAGVVVAAILFARRYNVPLGSLTDCLAVVVPIGLFLGRVANFINAELWGRATAAPWGVVFPGVHAQDCAGVIGTCARHPSQLYEAALEGLLLGAILMVLALMRGWLKTPWRLTGVFLIGYGASRMFVELFRQADAQFITIDNPMGYVIGSGSVGLSMGQLLSIPMIIFGLIALRQARRS